MEKKKEEALVDFEHALKIQMDNSGSEDLDVLTS
jgi:hypothetical protein